MFSKDQYDQMLYLLSSFYRDFLPLDNHLLKLIQVYAKTIDYTWDLFREAEDSSHIATTRTLSSIPYFRVDIEDGLYDLTTARVLARLNIEQQIQELDKRQKYASFVFHNEREENLSAVYSMRLFTDFTSEEPLQLYEDYFIRANRLYLLPHFVQNRKQSGHHLHAFDIKYNDYALEKNFGTLFSLKTGHLLPRHEYRDVIEAFMRMFQGDLTIKSIREAIQLATKWEQFKLEDYKSPNLSPRKRQLYNDWIISPFRFILSLPESLISDKVRISIIRMMLNEAKEQHTNFMIFFEIDRIDPYAVPMKSFPTTRYPFKDKMSGTDESNVPLVRFSFTEFPMDLYGRYDSSFVYNWSLLYDDPTSHEVIGLKQTPVITEEMNAGSTAEVTHHQLRIPRNFIATKNNETGDIFFSMDSNGDTTTDFELYASVTEQGPYELMETIPNNQSVSTISFVHNAKGSGKLYYKSRSKDPNITSLFTLPISINEV